ncbi:uncharacterized protein LOC123529047 isoform X2 [Mercenaria mercenaria]|uniref:uncharacterized protein LOC123529047 isoform X2 n=1 Tax=Mercenaria mercenaria TaxID=6596 RepID=UPI00234F8BE4|nr:uncharacterized protein LOC123529047 isoform X2 [Mercenaria mercenaria]
MKTQLAWLLCSTLSVLFHFDCVTTSRSSDIVEVSLTLKSSPVPGEKSLTPVSSMIKLTQEYVLYKGHGRYKRGSLFRSYGILPPLQDKPIVRKQVVMKINFTVVGSMVEVKFGPVQEDMTYRVCLSPVSKDYECYSNEVAQQGQDVVVFKNVEAGTYRIFVQRGGNPDNPMYASKPFNVTEVPPETPEPRIAGSVVAIITMTCLLFVAGLTTLCFCLMRERCHCIPWNCKICSCVLYHRTPHSVPNNIQEDGEDDDSILQVLPLYYDESEVFTTAVQKICLYLSKWSNCRINYNWTASYSNEPSLSIKDNHLNCILLIFLSSKMWKLLSDCQQDTDQTTQLFKRVLESNGKAFQKMVISLHPLAVNGKCSKGINIFRMTKRALVGNQHGLEMNTEDLYTMLEQLNVETRAVQRGWSSFEELSVLYEAIKYIPEIDLDLGEHLFVSKDDNNINRETLNMPSQKTKEVNVIQTTAGCPDKHCLCSVTQKQAATYQWASSQQIGCGIPYNQSGYVPPSVYHTVHEVESESIPHDVDMDIESASECQDTIYQRETIQSGYHRCNTEAHPVAKQFDHVIANHHGDWLPPEDDCESVSHSVIGQKQVEFYWNYKANVGDTRL